MQGDPSETFRTIQWHLFLNTPKEKGAQVILSRVQKLLEVEIELVSMERYWKIETLYDVRFTSAIEADDPAAAVWELLTHAQRLTHGYQTSGPLLEASGQMEMALLSNAGFRDPGINWLEASVRNH